MEQPNSVIEGRTETSLSIYFHHLFLCGSLKEVSVSVFSRTCVCVCVHASVISVLTCVCMAAQVFISWACICYSACMEVGVFLAACHCTCRAAYLWAPMEPPVSSSHLVLEVWALQMWTAAQALCDFWGLEVWSPHLYTGTLPIEPFPQPGACFWLLMLMAESLGSSTQTLL